VRHDFASNGGKNYPAASRGGTYRRNSARTSAGDSPTIVPEQLIEKIAELSTSAPSTNLAEVDTLAPRESDQAEEQQPEVAQSTLADATAHGKAMVVAETVDSRPAPHPE
jgi:hypothetical protein